MKAFSTFENIETKPTGIVASLTAGGAGDASEVTGVAIDTLDFLSAKLCVAFKAVLTEAKTLALLIKVAESDDNVTYGSDQTLLASTAVSTGGTGGTTNYEVYELKIDLSSQTLRKRYLKFKITPDLNASSTDTAIIAASLDLGGARNKPVTH